MQVSVKRKKDMCNYLGVFLLSQISILNAFIPFVIGFIEKREKDLYKKLILYGCSVLTVAFKFSLLDSIQYLVSIIVLLSGFEFSKYKDMQHTKLNAIIIFAGIFLTSIGFSMLKKFVLYDMAISAFVACLAVLGYCFFDKFNFDFEQIDEKNFIMITTFVGAILATFSNVELFNISMRNVIAIYIVLSFAYLKSLKYAVLSGVIIATINEIIKSEMGLFIISLTLGGFIAGLFKNKGKIAVVSGFLLGNTILAYYLIGYEIMVAKFFEIIIAGVLLIVTEKKLQIATNIFEDSPLMLATASNNIIENFDDTSAELYNISTVLDKLEDEPDEKEDIFDILKNDICINCKFAEKCWEDNYDNTMDDIFNYIEKIEDDSFESFCDDKIFKYSYCKDERKIKNKILLEYGRYKQNKDTISPVELKKCVSTQIKGISRYISNITNKAKEDNIKNIEQRIINGFERNNLTIEKAMVEMKEDDCKVELKGNKIELKNNIPKSNALLSGILNKRMVNVNQNGNSFRQAEKFKIKIGIATKNANNQKVSGDTYKLIDFLEDKYIMILSDGMGIGKEAQELSSSLVNVYTSMAESSISTEMITTIISSFAQYMSNSEKIITLDTTVVNLVTGECEFIKIGGAPTFIIKKDCVDIIYSDTLPMGIFEEVEFYKEVVALESGDIIVSVTDGVIDSKREIINKEFWVSGFLKNLYIDEPQIIAEELLQKTIENYNGNILDDVTIIVQKVM